MAVIYGTEGNDDGVTAPRLMSSSTPSTLFGLGGDDVLVSASRPFDPTPDVLHGGTGNDLYILPPLGFYFIYSTPIIWVPFAGDVVVHEIINDTDTADRIDLTDAGYDIQTSAVFDGSDIVIQAFARTIRLVDNYGVDAQGNLLAGVDLATMAIYGPPPPGSTLDGVVSIETVDLKRRSAEFDFLRNGTAAADVLDGDGLANVIEGGAGKDTLRGGGGHDFIAGGTGVDKLFGDDGDDRLFGGDGNDRIDGGTGNDRLAGMRGNDRMLGGLGDDSYVHAGRGDGLDTIDDAGGAADAIVFGDGVSFGDLVFAQVGADLTITIAGLKKTGVKILGQAGTGRIETLQFADGSSHDLGAAFNRAPVAADDALVAIAGRTSVFHLFADNGAGPDGDPDGDAFAASAGTFTTAGGGTVTIAADGTAEYRPLDGFSGTDSFTYAITDSYGASDEGLVTLQVSGNRAPLARTDLFAGLEDVAIAGNVLADNGQGADSDPDGDPLTVLASSFTTAAGGRVALAADGSFTYAPLANRSGSDSFDYTIADGFGGTATGTVMIELAAVNDAPRAVADSFTIDASRLFAGNVLANDSDPDGNPLTVRAASFVTAAGSGVTIAADGSFTFFNYGGHLTQDVFTYTVEDGQGGVSTAQVLVNLRAPSGATTGTAADDIIAGGAGRDVIFGQSGKDDIVGSSGNDLLFGGSLDDDLDGGAGNDFLYGGLGVDKLVGGAGDDYLHGGWGADELKGDEGADTFAFTTLGEGPDQIKDFKRSEGDILDLRGTLSVAFDPAVHQVTDFVRITEVGPSSVLAIDPDGAAGPRGFTSLASLLTTTGLTDEQALYEAGVILL